MPPLKCSLLYSSEPHTLIINWSIEKLTTNTLWEREIGLNNPCQIEVVCSINSLIRDPLTKSQSGYTNTETKSVDLLDNKNHYHWCMSCIRKNLSSKNLKRGNFKSTHAVTTHIRLSKHHTFTTRDQFGRDARTKHSKNTLKKKWDNSPSHTRAHKRAHTDTS